MELSREPHPQRWLPDHPWTLAAALSAAHAHAPKQRWWPPRSWLKCCFVRWKRGEEGKAAPGTAEEGLQQPGKGGAPQGDRRCGANSWETGGAGANGTSLKGFWVGVWWVFFRLMLFPSGPWGQCTMFSGHRRVNAADTCQGIGHTQRCSRSEQRFLAEAEGRKRREEEEQRKKMEGGLDRILHSLLLGRKPSAWSDGGGVSCESRVSECV